MSLRELWIRLESNAVVCYPNLRDIRGMMAREEAHGFHGWVGFTPLLSQYRLCSQLRQTRITESLEIHTVSYAQYRW